jgi:hypothetical protein
MNSLIALMMEAASTFETSIKFYQTTRRNNPEDEMRFQVVTAASMRQQAHLKRR